MFSRVCRHRCSFSTIEDAITTKSSTGHSVLQWTAFSKVMEGQNAIGLVDKTIMYVFPRRAFSSQEWDKFFSLLRQHVPVWDGRSEPFACTHRTNVNDEGRLVFPDGAVRWFRAQSPNANGLALVERTQQQKCLRVAKGYMGPRPVPGTPAVLIRQLGAIRRLALLLPHACHQELSDQADAIQETASALVALYRRDLDAAWRRPGTHSARSAARPSSSEQQHLCIGPSSGDLVTTSHSLTPASKSVRGLRCPYGNVNPSPLLLGLRLSANVLR
jgi:hypothetical protein